MDVPTDGVNTAVLAGRLSSEPRAVVLESGTRLLRLEVTTKVSGATASAPVVWFDPPPKAPDLSAGDEVVVIGTVRRRWFGGAGGARSCTEVVAITVVPATRRAAVQRAVAAVTASVQRATNG